MGSDEITALQRFLDYGPIGIAGLALVLAVFGLIAKDIDENRYKLLRLVLIVGAFSLVAILVADFMKQDHRHDMRVSVWPLDGDVESENFPSPLVKVDQVEIDRTQPHTVEDDFIVTVDVSRAIKAVEDALGAATRTTDALNSMLSRLDEIEADLHEAQASSGVEALRLAKSVSGNISALSSQYSTDEENPGVLEAQ